MLHILTRRTQDLRHRGLGSALSAGRLGELQGAAGLPLRATAERVHRCFWSGLRHGFQQSLGRPHAGGGSNFPSSGRIRGVAGVAGVGLLAACLVHVRPGTGHGGTLCVDSRHVFQMFAACIRHASPIIGVNRMCKSQ